jgi:DNA-binding GntR family transcriptional regulator
MAWAPFNLRQQAYDRVRDLVRTGRLVPGARVSTLELSRRLGISRTPIREALSKLASEGIVREVPGFGAYVHQPDAGEVAELYGLREVLEAYAAREAAAHITDAELDRLDELCLRWRAIAHHFRDGGERFLDQRSRDLWIDIDEKFHETLLKAAGNRLLFKTVDDMRVISRTLEARRREPEGSLTLAMVARTYRDHMRLLRALRRRDGNAADHWMREQLRVGREEHLRLLHARKSADDTARAASDDVDSGGMPVNI